MEQSQVQLTRLLYKLFPAFNSSQYKGQNGKLVVVGGSLQYTGAPFYSAIASLKGGGDLAYIFCTFLSSTPIKSYSPEVIVFPCIPSKQEFVLQQSQLQLAGQNPKSDQELQSHFLK